MITVKTDVDFVVYIRVPEFKEKINKDLLEQALKEAGSEELDLGTAKYELVTIPDSQCGCIKRATVILTINPIVKMNKYINKTKIK